MSEAAGDRRPGYSPPPAGVNLEDIIHHHTTKEGGSITFSYKRDVVADSIGHVMAIPTTHLALWTFKNAFENPNRELVDRLYERWKDVPWKGDVLVRVGHGSIIGDVLRLFTIYLEKFKDTPISFANVYSLLSRAIFTPFVAFASLAARVRRADHYNPFTRTVTVFHPELAVGMHEIGHAKFFDERKPFVGASYALGRALPIVRSFTEWKATANAMRQFKNDEERLKATKIQEGAFGTYLMGDIIEMTLPFLPSFYRTALGTTIGIGINISNRLIRELFSVAWMTGVWAGSVAGHLLSRLPYPGKRQRFGWVFEGKKSDQGVPLEAPLGDAQVRYAWAPAPATSGKI